MTTAPKWLLPVAIVALLWNLLGCMAFWMDLRMTPNDVAKLSEAQQALYNSRPGWAVVATGMAVIGGALGCIGLLLKKRWAFPLLVVSLVGVLVQDYGLFVLARGATGGNMVALVLQGVVLLIAIALAWLAWRGMKRGWLA